MPTQTIIEAPDLAKLLSAADGGKWVALAPDYSAVWARAESVKTLLAALSEAERAQDPVFYKVPRPDSSHA